LDCDEPLDLVVPEGEIRYLQGEHFYCNVEIRGTLEVSQYNFTEGGQMVLHAEKDIVIVPTGLILADGAGYPSDKGPGAGLCFSGGSNGGAYGGLGGEGCCNHSEDLNIVLPDMQPIEERAVYGESETQTIEMGSGGGSGRGCSEGLGGSGGGAITLIARKIIIEGTISTNGTPELSPSKGSPGAGSGGGVLAIADERMVVSGRISACGGTPSDASWGGGGGGGGRVKLFADAGSVTGEIDVAGGEGGKGSRDSWNGFPGQEGSLYINY